jgi:hypothetical protein
MQVEDIIFRPLQLNYIAQEKAQKSFIETYSKRIEIIDLLKKHFNTNDIRIIWCEAVSDTSMHNVITDKKLVGKSGLMTKAVLRMLDYFCGVDAIVVVNNKLLYPIDFKSGMINYRLARIHTDKNVVKTAFSKHIDLFTNKTFEDISSNLNWLLDNLKKFYNIRSIKCNTSQQLSYNTLNKILRLSPFSFDLNNSFIKINTKYITIENNAPNKLFTASLFKNENSSFSIVI